MKRISIVGDSISTYKGFNPDGWRVFYADEATDTDVTAPEQTWWSRLITHFGGELHANASWSGSTVAGCSFPAGQSIERAEALAVDGQAPDAVVIFFGINDYGWGYSQYQINFKSLSAPKEGIPEPDAGIAGLVDPERALGEFREGYTTMLRNIRTLYPNAEVWACTLVPGRWEAQPYNTHPYCMRGAEFVDYNQIIRDACAETGCNCADIAALGYDYVALDGTHPTNRGMKQLAAMMVKSMRIAGCEWSPDPEASMNVNSILATCPKSERRCDKTGCLGCEHVKGMTGPWWCVCKKDMF